MNALIPILSWLIEPIITVWLCTSFTGYKKDRMTFVKSFLIFLLLVSVNTVVAIVLTPDDFFNFFSAALSAGIVLASEAFLMRGRIRDKLLISLTPIVFFALRLVLAEIDDIFPNGLGMWFELILKLVLLMICGHLIRRCKREKYPLTSFQRTIQLSSVLLSFFVIYFLWTVSDENRYSGSVFIFVSILIAAMNALLYFLLRKMQRDNAIEEAYMLSQINLAAQKKFVLEARERYFEMRTLRHDMRHYLTAAAELISDGKPEEAKLYIETILDEKINAAAVGMSTGSAVIDAIVNNRLTICAQRGIETKCTVDTKSIGSAEIDISILLSNLLDNAIEGCGSALAVELLIESRKSMLFITVKNSIDKPVLTDNPTLATSKDDSDSHGYGVMSVKRIAEKYNGSAEFRDENGFFIAEVWLTIPDDTR